MIYYLIKFIFCPIKFTFVPVGVTIDNEKEEEIVKKKNVLNLIKYHIENNDLQFRNEAVKIAKAFDSKEDYQLSEYIMGLLSSANTFVPQGSSLDDTYFREVEVNTDPLPLPEPILEDIKGIINAVNHGVGINKFLFSGSPGTGKTETAKQVARLLDRHLYMVEFSELVDSKLGETAKNMVKIFNDINKMPYPNTAVILFDELDVIAMDRVNDRDVREMGRATSTLLKELDRLNDEIVLIATSNLADLFDKALLRRFDSSIDFDRYQSEDLIEIAEVILNGQLKKFKNAGRDMKLFRKIMGLSDNIPSPGELQNLIKVSLAFSDPNNPFDYLKRLLKQFSSENMPFDLKILKYQGFTVREIEMLTGVSKSQVSRELKEN